MKYIKFFVFIWEYFHVVLSFRPLGEIPSTRNSHQNSKYKGCFVITLNDGWLEKYQRSRSWIKFRITVPYYCNTVKSKASLVVNRSTSRVTVFENGPWVPVEVRVAYWRGIFNGFPALVIILYSRYGIWTFVSVIKSRISHILSVHLYQVQSDLLLVIKVHNFVHFVQLFSIQSLTIFPTTAKGYPHELICRSSQLCDVMLLAVHDAAGFVVNVHIKYSFDDWFFNVLADHPNASGIWNSIFNHRNVVMSSLNGIWIGEPGRIIL